MPPAIFWILPHFKRQSGDILVYHPMWAKHMKSGKFIKLVCNWSFGGCILHIGKTHMDFKYYEMPSSLERLQAES